MANRRMFSRELTESDKFLEMPSTTQALFFHLGMNADDEGFTSSPKKVMRMCGCREDDLSVLKAKEFIVEFDSGIVVITNWHQHNQIRRDRFKPTIHQAEKAELANRLGTDLQPLGNQMATSGCPSIGKSSIVEYSLVEDSNNNSQPEESSSKKTKNTQPDWYKDYEEYKKFCVERLKEYHTNTEQKKYWDDVHPNMDWTKTLNNAYERLADDTEYTRAKKRWRSSTTKQLNWTLRIKEVFSWKGVRVFKEQV